MGTVGLLLSLIPETFVFVFVCATESTDILLTGCIMGTDTSLFNTNQWDDNTYPII